MAFFKNDDPPVNKHRPTRAFRSIPHPPIPPDSVVLSRDTYHAMSTAAAENAVLRNALVKVQHLLSNHATRCAVLDVIDNVLKSSH